MNLLARRLAAAVIAFGASTPIVFAHPSPHGHPHQSDHHPGREASINERQYMQQRRIEEGFRSGELTRREARRLEAELAVIRRKEHAFRSDGHLDRMERRELHSDLDRLSRLIAQERHDRQARY